MECNCDFRKHESNQQQNTYYQNLIMYESRIRSIIRENVDAKEKSKILSMGFKELCAEFNKLMLSNIYPVLDYVIRLLLDDDIPNERKSRLMECCYKASFTPNFKI